MRPSWTGGTKSVDLVRDTRAIGSFGAAATTAARYDGAQHRERLEEGNLYVGRNVGGSACSEFLFKVIKTSCQMASIQQSCEIRSRHSELRMAGQFWFIILNSEVLQCGPAWERFV